MIIIEIQVGGDRWEHEMPQVVADLLCAYRRDIFGCGTLSELIERLPWGIRDTIKSTKIEPKIPTPDTYGVWIDEIVSKDMLGDIMGLNV